MAKRDLIGGSLWEQYSDKVNERMENPKYFGELTEEDARARGGKLVVADHGAEACGDAIRLTLIFDPETDKILDARYKTFGCGTAIASSDVMTEMCIGKTADEALNITNLDVEHALRDNMEEAAIPAQKMHCSVMAYDVIKHAMSIYKGVDVQDLENEDIVCECARVSLGTIKDVIRLNDLTSVEEITNYTKAGAFCKSCIRPGGHESRKYYLVDILKDTRAEMEAEKAGKSPGAFVSPSAGPAEEKFEDLNVIGKHKAVERVLDETVRPHLAADGGNVEVTDIQPDGNNNAVVIRYTGACRGCAGASTVTLGFIEETLQEQLSPSITVTSS
ncbi:MAG: iron-sulfur cluster assembly scaffold protein [Spirochaetaceae bacterium]